MKEKSLTKTNPWISRDSSNGKFLERNIASSTAIETGRSVKVTSASVLSLQAAKPAKLTKKSS